MKTIIIIATAVLLTFAVSLKALTLQEAVSYSITNNPKSQEYESTLQITKTDLSTAESEYLPTLDLVSQIGEEYTEDDNSHFIATNNLSYYENALTLRWNIFKGFGTKYKVQFQEAQIHSAQMKYLEVSNDVAFKITKTYLEMLKKNELVVSAQKEVEINEKLYNDIKGLFESGNSIKSEVTKIQTSLELARANLIAANNNAQDAVFQFEKVFGLFVKKDQLETFEDINQIQIDINGTLAENRKLAYTNNPSILASLSNIKAAKLLRKQEKNNYYPSIDLLAQQNLDNDTYGLQGDKNRARVGVELKWNLYNAGRDDINDLRNLHKVNKEVTIFNDKQREVVEGLELGFSAYENLTNRLVYLNKYTELAKETLTLQQEEYKLGRRTILDILAATRDLINSNNQVIEANYDLLIAKYRILDAQGSLVKTIIPEVMDVSEIEDIYDNKYEYVD